MQDSCIRRLACNRPILSFPGDSVSKQEVTHSAFDMEMIFHSHASLIVLEKPLWGEARKYVCTMEPQFNEPLYITKSSV